MDLLVCGLLLVAGVLALATLPWTDPEIAAVHQAAVALRRGTRLSPQRRRSRGPGV